MLANQADSSILLATTLSARSRPSPLEEEVTGLYDQLRNPLLRYLLSFGLSPQDGEEVIQEVFLALFQHLRRGKSRENLHGWLFRVAHNLGLKRCYSNRNHLQLLTHQGEELDPDPNPEQQVADRQRRERLLAVVSALPEQDRCCLHLRAEGLRYRDIAAVLGISLGAVSMALERSLARLSRADGR